MKVPLTFLQHPRVNAVAISPDGRLALTVVSSERTLRLFSLDSGEEVQASRPAGITPPFLQLPGANDLLWAANFTPDSQRVVTVGGNDVRIWDLATGTEQMRFGPHGTVASAQFSPDDKRVVTASWDHSAKLWDVATGKALRKLVGHDGNVNSACFSPDGQNVLTSSDDGTAMIWNADGRSVLALVGHQGPVLDAEFSADGASVLTASSDGTARLWDRFTGEQRLVFDDQQAAGKTVAWQASPAVPVSHPTGVRCARFFWCDGAERVVTGGEDGTAKIWNSTTGQRIVTLEGHMSAVTAVACSPDGKRMVTGSQDATAKIWDTSTGKEVLTLKGHQQEVTSVEFSPNGRVVLTASRDGLAILWLAAGATHGDESPP